MFNLVIISFLSLLSSIIIGKFLYKTDLPDSLIDKPDNRKVHSTPTPLIGGITIIFSFLFITIIYQLFIEPAVQLFIIFSLYFFFIGLFDDLFRWNYKKKFLLQIIGVVAFVFSVSPNFAIISFSSFTSNILFINYFLIGVWILFIVNAFNFLDGINFLAGSLSILFFSSYAIFYASQGNILVVSILLIMIFSIIGFLTYNRAPAKMFLGDAGSMYLGFALAAFPFIFVGSSNRVGMTFFVIVLFILVSDMVFVVITRILRNKNPFRPDKTHLHHQLLNLDFRNRYVVLIITLGAMTHSILAFSSQYLSFILILLLLTVINIIFIIFPRFLPHIVTRYNLWSLKKIYDRSINYLKH